MIGLAIIGFFIATIWAPLVLHFWGRETHLLAEKWNLSGYVVMKRTLIHICVRCKNESPISTVLCMCLWIVHYACMSHVLLRTYRYKQTVFESNDENANYSYTWEQNILTQQWEKQPKKRKLGILRFTNSFFILVSCLLQMVLLLPFIQVTLYI